VAGLQGISEINFMDTVSTVPENDILDSKIYSIQEEKLKAE
jgi:hypothetical protein